MIDMPLEWTPGQCLTPRPAATTALMAREISNLNLVSPSTTFEQESAQRARQAQHVLMRLKITIKIHMQRRGAEKRDRLRHAGARNGLSDWVTIDVTASATLDFHLSHPQVTQHEEHINRLDIGVQH